MKKTKNNKKIKQQKTNKYIYIYILVIKPIIVSPWKSYISYQKNICFSPIRLSTTK